jgi:hypothetical protein
MCFVICPSVFCCFHKFHSKYLESVKPWNSCVDRWLSDRDKHLPGGTDDNHVDVVRPCLWTATTNGLIVHSRDDVWVWRAMVERRRQEKTPDSSTRALCQSYEHSHEELGEGNGFGLRSIFVHTKKWHFSYREILRYGTSGFTSPPKEGVLRILIALKNPSPSAGFLTREPWVKWQTR